MKPAIDAALRLLQLVESYASLRERIGRCTTVPEGEVQLRDWLRNEARPAYRKLAFDAHPDRGGDPERMKALSAAYQELGKIKVLAPPRPQFIVYTPRAAPAWGHACTWTSTGSGTYSTSTTFDWAAFDDLFKVR